MRRNVGTMDRFIRIMVGIPLLTYGVMHSSWLGILGGVLIATGFIGFCGLYTFFSADTCKKNSQGICEI